MSRLSKAALITFVVATLAGSCLHFLYALWPNGLTALLAPVNESLWEHVKILYWPSAGAQGAGEPGRPRLLPAPLGCGHAGRGLPLSCGAGG